MKRKKRVNLKNQRSKEPFKLVNIVCFTREEKPEQEEDKEDQKEE